MDPRTASSPRASFSFFADNDGAEPQQKVAKITDANKRRHPQYKVEIISEADYSARRQELYAKLTDWKKYFNSYYSQENDDAFADQLRKDWDLVLANILQYTSQSVFPATCFLLYDNNNELQGFGLCKWKSYFEKKNIIPGETFYINDLLSAPWNVLPRIHGTNKTDKPMLAGVGTALLSTIIEYADDVMNAKRIALVPGFSDESDVEYFYTKNGFDRTDINEPFMNMRREDFKAFLEEHPAPAEIFPEGNIRNEKTASCRK